MDNPIAEMGSKHFPFFRVGDNEALGGLGLVGAFQQVFAKRIDVPFQVGLEAQ